MALAKLTPVVLAEALTLCVFLLFLFLLLACVFRRHLERRRFETWASEPQKPFIDM